MIEKIYWAGIGARITPPEIGKQMKQIAQYLSKNYYFHFVCRSGGAAGADTFFADGCDPGHVVIFRPSSATDKARLHAKQFCSYWDNTKDYTKNLFARNAQIILGQELDNHAKFVVCWSPDGKEVGGTGHALRIAQQAKIPIYNLYFPEVLKKVVEAAEGYPEVLWKCV